MPFSIPIFFIVNASYFGVGMLFGLLFLRQRSNVRRESAMQEHPENRRFVGQAVLQSKTAQSGPWSRVAVEWVSEAPQERNEERRLCRPEWSWRRNAAAPLMLLVLLFTSWSVSERCEAENIHIWAFSIFYQAYFEGHFIFPTFPPWKNKSGNARKWTYFFIYFSMVIRHFAAHGKINKSHSQVVCR